MRLLVTSREQLGLPHETVVPVAGLDGPPGDGTVPTVAEVAASSAGMLFIDAARRVRPDFDPTPDDAVAIARICELVRGHPLALILAATWLDVSTCADVALELDSGIDVLATRSDQRASRTTATSRRSSSAPGWRSPRTSATSWRP